jgi:hypothetical protein
VSRTPEEIEAAIRKTAASETPVRDLTLPENAYVVGKRTPWGWNLYSHRDLTSAASDGANHVSQGNTDVYILDSQGVQFSLIEITLLR